MLNAGTFIQNRYEIISKIGSGGMADVYKAKDHKLNRQVAIKVLKSEFREDKVLISKFRTEAQSAAGLSHGNIVNIYDVGEEAGINYIVMELVEGVTLKEYIKDQGRLSVKEATSIALQISAGLEAAHNNGIIHRDVKPQNIMISTDGKVKVADFGIARATSANTVTSNVMGSVHYSSPEQARGGYSDEKSDIYSLGITIYEMLTGHVPFNGDTAVEVALQHLQDEMHGPKEEVPEIPFSTNQIVLKCTQKNPDRRYQNMAELIRDLRESLVNPDGDFVVLPLDPDSPTLVMSREDVDQLKSEQKMPTYDESIDVGAAADIHRLDEPAPDTDRAYKPGSYFEQSRYQNTPSGRQDEYYDADRWNAGYGMDDLDDLDDPEYHPYFDDSYEDADGYTQRFDDTGDYRLNDDFEPVAGKEKKEDDLDGDLNPNLEKAVTIGGIIIAVVIGCVLLVLLANAFGLFRISGGGRSDNDAVVAVTETTASSKETSESPAETERRTEAPTEAPATFELQSLYNMEQSQAQTLLISDGLQYSVDNSQFSETVPSGYVISTNPAAGSAVQRGDTITLFVSQGSEANVTYVTLWDLTGYTLERAQEALQMLGLTADYEYESSDTIAEGYITRTSADESNGEVRSGGTVTLYISTGFSGTAASSPSADSQTGEAENGNEGANITIINDGGNTSTVSSGVWQCDASLTVPAGYTGQAVRITLEQNGLERIVFEGNTTFPYHLQVTGEDNVGTGTAYVYLLDDDNNITSKIEYAGIEFSEVN